MGRGRILRRCWNWEECSNPHKVDGDLNYCITGSAPKALRHPVPKPINSDTLTALYDSQIQTHPIVKAMQNARKAFAGVGTAAAQAGQAINAATATIVNSKHPVAVRYIVHDNPAISFGGTVRTGAILFDATTCDHFEFDAHTNTWGRMNDNSGIVRVWNWPTLELPQFPALSKSMLSFLIPAINVWQRENDCYGTLPKIESAVLSAIDEGLYPKWTATGDFDCTTNDLNEPVSSVPSVIPPMSIAYHVNTAVPTNPKLGDVWFDQQNLRHMQFEPVSMQWIPLNSNSMLIKTRGWPMLDMPGIVNPSDMEKRYVLPAINKWQMDNDKAGVLPVLSVEALNDGNFGRYPVWNETGTYIGSEGVLGYMAVPQGFIQTNQPAYAPQGIIPNQNTLTQMWHHDPNESVPNIVWNVNPAFEDRSIPKWQKELQKIRKWGSGQ